MRSGYQEYFDFERRGRVYRIKGCREIKFFNQISNGTVNVNPGDSFLKIATRLNYNPYSLHSFLDKNADFILDYRGNIKNLRFLRR